MPILVRVSLTFKKLSGVGSETSIPTPLKMSSISITYSTLFYIVYYYHDAHHDHPIYLSYFETPPTDILLCISLRLSVVSALKYSLATVRLQEYTC